MASREGWEADCSGQALIGVAPTDRFTEMARVMAEATSSQRALVDDFRRSVAGFDNLAQGIASSSIAGLAGAGLIDRFAETARIAAEATSSQRALNHDFRRSMTGINALALGITCSSIAGLANAGLTDRFAEAARFAAEVTSPERVGLDALARGLALAYPSIASLTDAGLSDRFTEIARIASEVSAAQRAVADNFSRSVKGLDAFARGIPAPRIAGLTNAELFGHGVLMARAAEAVSFPGALANGPSASFARLGLFTGEAARPTIEGLINARAHLPYVEIGRVIEDVRMLEPDPVSLRLVRLLNVTDWRLVAPASHFRLVKPRSTEPLILCARCGREMTIQDQPTQMATADRDTIPVYPGCDCVVMDWVERICTGPAYQVDQRARRRRTRPAWLRGVYEGGRRGDGTRAGEGILRIMRREK